MAFAVRTADEATPLALVIAVVAPPARVALAPVPGAVNVTVTPLTGLPPASFTVACNGFAKAAPSSVLCELPAVAVMLAGAPAVFVSAKLAGVATPATAAVTA